MDRPDEFPTAADSPAEPVFEPSPKRVRRLITPHSPMTAEEHEALLELIAMMQITPDELSEEQYQELHKLWA